VELDHSWRGGRGVAAVDSSSGEEGVGNSTFELGTPLEHWTSADKLLLYFTHSTQPFHPAILGVEYIHRGGLDSTPNPATMRESVYPIPRGWMFKNFSPPPPTKKGA
jgi:hypothetical protein